MNKVRAEAILLNFIEYFERDLLVAANTIYMADCVVENHRESQVMSWLKTILGQSIVAYAKDHVTRGNNLMAMRFEAIQDALSCLF